MKRFLFALLIVSLTVLPVSALELTAPPVPESGREFLPEEPESFSEGLWEVIKAGLVILQPSFVAAARVCVGITAVMVLISLLRAIHTQTSRIINLVAAVTIASMLLKPANALIHLGTQTVEELSEYGKLLLPVMTAAMAAQGGITASGALYTGTALFDAILTSGISKLLVPLIYAYLALAVGNAAMGEDVLKQLRDFAKWLITWGLKGTLYLFTGYIGITGVVSGTADAVAVKAAKLAISGVVPVVGGMLSDASESVLVSASAVKNAVGVYGMLALLAIWIGPFIQIGAQYLFLKLTSAVSTVFAGKEIAGLLQDFTSAMGLILAMVGTVCLLLLISTVCYLKGVT